jgi:hypothetical protein
VTRSTVARRALPAVVAGILTVCAAAAAQDQPPESPGTAKIGRISASPFGSSIFVEVQCPVEGHDCQGDLTARTTSRVRAPGSRAPRRVPIDTTFYSVPKGQVERRRLSNPKAVCLHLRHTGRLGVEITLTVATEGTAGPPVDPQVTTTVVRAPKKPKAKCKS